MPPSINQRFAAGFRKIMKTHRLTQQHLTPYLKRQRPTVSRLLAGRIKRGFTLKDASDLARAHAHATGQTGKIKLWEYFKELDL